jgi:hypothetical protein
MHSYLNLYPSLHSQGPITQAIMALDNDMYLVTPEPATGRIVITLNRGWR